MTQTETLFKPTDGCRGDRHNFDLELVARHVLHQSEKRVQKNYSSEDEDDGHPSTVKSQDNHAVVGILYCSRCGEVRRFDATAKGLQE